MARRLLRISQAADRIGVTPLTLRRWDKQGILKPIRIGRRRDRRYDPGDIEKLLKKRAV